MKKTQYLLWSLLIIGTLSSCYYDNKEDLYKNFDTSCDTTGVISYSMELQSVFMNNCAISGCHSGPTPQSNLDLGLYADVKSIADNGNLVGRITGSSGPLMPPSGSLSACDIEKITVWVNRGANNN